MQCLILAGGLGTRMKNISGHLPKALLPLGNLKFIDIQLQWLKILGVTDVVLSLGHGGELIQQHVESVQSDRRYPQVNYIYDGPQLLGTGGAVKKALPMLSKDFIVTYGDTVLFLNVEALKRKHYLDQKPITMTVLKNRDVGDKSNIIFKEGKIALYDKFHRTQKMDHIDYGMSVIQKEYFTKNSHLDSFDLADILTQASKSGDLNAFLVTHWFQEIGSPEGYHNLEKTLQSYNFDLFKMASEKGLLDEGTAP